MMMWVVLLFLAGATLIVAEFFVPGLVCGVTGFLMVIGSGALGVYHYPDYALYIIVAEALGAAICFVIGILLITKTRAGNHLRLVTEQRSEDGYVNQESEVALIGATGVVFSALRPSGSVLVGERRIDAISDGAFIEKDEAIKVIEVHGNRVVVEALRAN